MSNANEPAFPISVQRGQSGEYWTEQEGGLTKREYFAALAMQGLVDFVPGCPAIDEKDAKHIATYAVRCADALLTELAK